MLLKYILMTLRIYFVVGFPYGLWALAFLNIRTCLLESGCLPPLANAPKTFLIVVIAVTRGILWGPNLIISLRDGRFVDDWLLFRDVAPMDQLLKAIGW
jgi:hypothetical protein